jgi:imidazolonepropionase-like amidohydrolase
MRAAVQAASDWGTYVAAHVYTAAGIRRALDTGVRSIEHGHLADEATVRLMADKGAWWSTQPLEPGDNALSPGFPQFWNNNEMIIIIALIESS